MTYYYINEFGEEEEAHDLNSFNSYSYGNNNSSPHHSNVSPSKPRNTIRATVTTTKRSNSVDPSKLGSRANNNNHRGSPSSSHPSPSSPSGSERWAQLANNRRKEYSRREQEKFRREKEIVEQNCPFQPSITSKTRKRASSCTHSRGSSSVGARATTSTTTENATSGNNQQQQQPHSSSDLFERLAMEAIERQKRREQEAKRRREEIEAMYPFEPKTSASKFIDSEKYIKPENKAMIILKEKQERLRQLGKRYMEDPNLTFQPQISEKSQQLAQEQLERDKFSIYERARRLQNEKRLRRQTENHITELEEMCTFHPSLNTNSERILTASDLATTTFFERQKLFKEREEQERRLLHDREAEYMNTLFQPKVNRTSEALHSIYRGGETDEERIERLSKTDSERKERKQRELQHKYYDQFSYQPQISEVSKQIGQATDPEELVHNHRNKFLKQYVTENWEKEWKREHTFKPTLIASPKEEARKYQVIDPSSPEKTQDNIGKYHEMRERKLEIVKQEVEKKELKECTFSPSTNKPKRMVAQAGPVVIRGLSRHLERRDRAKKLEEEKRDREEKVFRPRVSRPDPNLKYTIPMPFKNLHPDNYVAQKEIKRMELIEKYHRILEEELAH